MYVVGDCLENHRNHLRPHCEVGGVLVSYLIVYALILIAKNQHVYKTQNPMMLDICMYSVWAFKDKECILVIFFSFFLLK